MMTNDKLWSDLTTDEDRLEFIRYGRAVQTGIMAPAVADDVADMLARMIKQQAEIERLQRDMETLIQCRTHNVQACHVCPDIECGDNMKIKEVESE